MSLSVVGIFIVVSVLLLLALTFCLYYYFQWHSCQNYPNYWCWTDWQCFNESQPDKQFPAQHVYSCQPGVVRDRNFCNKPENANALGCRCNLARTGGTVPPECGCQWGQGGTGNLGPCGSRFCSGGSVEHCGGN